MTSFRGQLKPNRQYWQRLLLVLTMMVAVCSTTVLSALASVRKVSFEDLHLPEYLYLPTVSSQQEVPFTVPKTWQVSGSSYIEVVFQHSTELLPNRSRLEIILNERLVQKIALTKENAKATTVRIPINAGMLKEENLLKFRVEQHYTDKCEDPLDPSLWTQVLSDTHIHFDYQPILPTVDLRVYPFPIVDPLAYDPIRVQYLVPTTMTPNELEALTLTQAHLSQQDRKHEIKARVLNDSAALPDAQSHLILVGTPKSLPALKRYRQQTSQFALEGDRWLEAKSGQPLGDDTGILVFVRRPDVPSRALVMVTGNSDRAVQKAAKLLTTRPRPNQLTGQELAVTGGWDGGSPVEVQYVIDQSKPFSKMGFQDMRVEKIYAPPISYPISVVTSFKEKPGELNPPRMWLDLTYSYGPGLNPKFSSLEIRMNDRAIANIPLLNEQTGETKARAKINIPNELIQPNNNLVAQFHMLPDKYGWCVDNYEDKAWGVIHDESEIGVSGSVRSMLPNVGILNNTGFPYSRNPNLEKLHLVVPKDASSAMLEAAMAVVGRIGRGGMANTALQLSVGQTFEGAPGGRNVLLFSKNKVPQSLQPKFLLNWITPGQKVFVQNNQKTVTIGDAPEAATMEQEFMPGSSNEVVTLFSARTDATFVSLRNLFEDDKRFGKLALGQIQQLLSNDLSLNAVDPEIIKIEGLSLTSASAETWMDKAKRFTQEHPIWSGVIAVALLLLVLLILSFIVGLFKRGR